MFTKSTNFFKQDSEDLNETEESTKLISKVFEGIKRKLKSFFAKSDIKSAALNSSMEELRESFINARDSSIDNSSESDSDESVEIVTTPGPGRTATGKNLNKTKPSSNADVESSSKPPERKSSRKIKEPDRYAVGLSEQNLKEKNEEPKIAEKQNSVQNMIDAAVATAIANERKLNDQAAANERKRIADLAKVQKKESEEREKELKKQVTQLAKEKRTLEKEANKPPSIAQGKVDDSVTVVTVQPPPLPSAQARVNGAAIVNEKSPQLQMIPGPSPNLQNFFVGLAEYNSYHTALCTTMNNSLGQTYGVMQSADTHKRQAAAYEQETTNVSKYFNSYL